jgi:hypothetical protein
MKEICVIGNSHIAALKLGWDAIRSDFPDVELFFFGAPGRKMVGLTAANGQLEPTNDVQRKYFRQTSGGRESIHGNYDAYLFHALQFSIGKLEWFIGKERSEDQQRDARRPISGACFLECFVGILRDTRAVETIVELRKITAAPVTLTAQAMPSEDESESILAQLDRIGDAAAVHRTFDAAANILADELKIEFFPQPAETLAGPCRTKRLYSTDSVGLAGGLKTARPKDDYYHMNAAFGALLLRTWLDSSPA